MPNSITEAEEAVHTLFLQVRRASTVLADLHDHYSDHVQARHRQQRDELAQRHAAARSQAQSEHAQRLIAADVAFTHGLDLMRAAWQEATAAYPWVTLPWDDPAWQDFAPVLRRDPPAGLRVGALRLDAAASPLPLFAPLVGHGHLFITGEPTAARDMLQTLLLRLAVSFPAGAFRLFLADVSGLGAALSAFLHLPDGLRSQRVAARGDEVGQMVELLSRHIASVVQDRLRNIFPNVEAYNAQSGEAAVPYHILAISDLPAGLDERSWQQLLDVARNGPRAGVYLLAQIDRSAPPVRGVTLADLSALGATLDVLAPDHVMLSDRTLGQIAATPDRLPAPAVVNRLLERVGKGAAQAAVSLDFGRIDLPAGARWREDSSQGLEVIIGIDATGVEHWLRLGQGVVHHGLIGGMIGSGKSNLLHVLISQLALRYAPEQLQLYLIDFKQGVEFQDYQRPAPCPRGGAGKRPGIWPECVARPDRRDGAAGAALRRRGGERLSRLSPARNPAAAGADHRRVFLILRNRRLPGSLWSCSPGSCRLAQCHLFSHSP
jgi:hypothetical protein